MTKDKNTFPKKYKNKYFSDNTILKFAESDDYVEGVSSKIRGFYTLSVEDELRRSNLKTFKSIVLFIEKKGLMNLPEVKEAQLSFTEVLAICAYTDTFYLDINKFLRGIYSDDWREFLKPEWTFSSTVRKAC